MTLGEKLYKLRQAAGMSQEDLAGRLEVSRQAISKWELDKTVPEVCYIVALSELFGVSTDYLLKDAPAEEVRVPPAPPRAEGPAEEPAPPASEDPPGAPPPARRSVAVPLLFAGDTNLITWLVLFVVATLFSPASARWALYASLVMAPALMAVSRFLLERERVTPQYLRHYRRAFALCFALWCLAIALSSDWLGFMEGLLTRLVSGLIPSAFSHTLLTALIAFLFTASGLLLARLVTRKWDSQA